MPLARKLLRAGDSFTDRVLCVVGAVLFSQAPEFMQQYLQRLGGHLDEARRQLAAFQHIAEKAGISLDRFITQTSANAEPTVAKLGGVMRETADRVTDLAAAQEAIQHASLWTRPFVFLRHLDLGIAQGTWSAYQPGVPTTFEGLVYALLGMGVLLVIYHFSVRRPIRRRLDRPKPTEPPPPAPQPLDISH
ncbi:MAG: DUF2937 family protein [Verrucomicrobia bacterium]|nr:DUF2937 family protein [Verrucomicrobiota bacterium]